MQELHLGFPSQPQPEINPEPLEHPNADWYRDVRKVCEVMAFTGGSSVLHLLVRGFSLVSGKNPSIILLLTGAGVGGLFISSRWSQAPAKKARTFWQGSAIATGTLMAWWDHLQLLAVAAPPTVRIGVFAVFGVAGWVVFQLWRRNRIYKEQQRQVQEQSQQYYQPYYGGFNYGPPQ